MVAARDDPTNGRRTRRPYKRSPHATTLQMVAVRPYNEMAMRSAINH